MSDAFLEELAAKLKTAAKKPNVLGYKPNSVIHEAFHRSTKVGRILRGGNRSGKSVAGAVESISRAIGKHPYQVTHDVPTRGRIVTVDKDSGIEQIIKPLLQQWVPPSELVNGSWSDSWQNRGSLLTFRNGSTIEVKTHQQEVESFAGIPLHWCWFDEECPQAIFNECRLRLIDYNGVWYMTMTPVEGQDWIFDRYVVNSAKNVASFEVDITDNPHLNKEALELLDEDLSDDEKKIRQRGIFVPRGGLVLDQFDLNRHAIDMPNQIPKNWAFYVSIDHGFNNPSAILWHAVSQEGEVVTFHEIYKRKTVIKDLAAEILLTNHQLKIKPQIYMCDPSMSQKTAETGTSPLQIYRDCGVPLVQAKKDVNGRINKMNEYLKYDMWHITRNCINTLKEARGYSFKIHVSPKIADRNNVREEPNKKNDHTMDSSGYFFNFMPYLSAAVKERKGFVSKTLTNREDFDWEVDAGFMHKEDEPVPEYGFGEYE